jgi:hypothetical protein
VFTLTANPLPTVSLNGSNVSCATCNNGTISASVSGGTAPYTYTWSPGNSNTQQITSAASGLYTVMVTDAFGCIGTDSLKIGFDVGITKFKTDHGFISISPNPSNGLYTINNKDGGTINIVVIDALGRLVKQLTSSAAFIELNLSSESKGVYYVQAKAGYKQNVIKLLKE